MLQMQLSGNRGVNLLELLLRESIGAESGGGIFAWTNGSGVYTALQDSVFQEFLANSKFELIVGTDTITDERARVALIKQMELRDNLSVRAFMNNGAALFHPKLAWFKHPDHLTVITGSANLTMGGLLSNWEAIDLSEYSGADEEQASSTIRQFIANHESYFADINSLEVSDRVAKNTGNERNLRRSDFHPAPIEDIEMLHAGENTLVAEIPGSGNRWKQANFDKNSYVNFFGAKIGAHRRVVFQNVNRDGSLGGIESRGTVEVKSQNYRFELSAASGLVYPDSGPPIGVFVKVFTGQFLYQLIMPDEALYDELAQLLDDRWDGPRRNKRRLTLTAEVLRRRVPDLPIWSAERPEL